MYKETKVNEEEAQKRREERRLKDKQDREVMKRAADDKKRREEEKRLASVKARPREFYVPIVDEVKPEKKENAENTANNNENNNTLPTDNQNNTNVANTTGPSEITANENNIREADQMQVEKSAGEGESSVKEEKNTNNDDKDDDKDDDKSKQQNADDDLDVGITYEDEQVVEEADEMKEEDLHAWEVVCRNTTDWGNFAEQFKQSKHAGEREIAAFISKNIIEHISTKMQAYLHAKRRTSLMPIQHRKKSTRLQMKEIQKIEQVSHGILSKYGN